MLRLAVSRSILAPLLSAAILAAIWLAAPCGAVAGERALGHGARARFTREGLSIRERAENEGGWSWEMPVRTVGRPGAMRAVLSADEPGDGNKVAYRRGPLTEWYESVGPAIEQSFTLSERPAGSGPLALRFELRTDLAPSISADARSVTFAAPHGERLRYADLAAFDASGKQLPARFALAGGELVLEVDDSGAAYPVTIDPLVYIEAKQVAFDASSDDGYGASVAVDGDTAVVGAPDDDDPIVGDGTGAAYVYVRSGPAWTLQQKITAPDMAIGDRFGAAVAIAGDTIVVGAPSDDDTTAGADAGSAYLFRRSGTVWTQLGKVLAPDLATGDAFGCAVAASGGTALVGSCNGDSGVANSGSTYVFLFDPAAVTVPTFEAELDASDAAADDSFGASVAIDADTAVVGAPANDDTGASSGSAYVFTRTGTVWTEQQKLTASDAAAGAQFGLSVGVSGDTLVVGAPFDDDQANDAGSAYVFERTGTTWNEYDEVYSGNPNNNEHMGMAVAISSDAILASAPDDGASQGEVNVFARSGVLWPRVLRLRASDRADGDQFGSSVAISGGSIAVGSPLDDDLIQNQGSAYLYYAYEQNVDLAVAATVNDPEPAEGGTVVFTVTVTNWGADDAGVVALSIPFPETLTFVDALASRGTYNPSTGLWAIGTLPRYSAVSLTLTGQAPLGSSGTTVTSTATLLAFDATPENNTATASARIGAQGSSSVFQNPGFEIDTTPADGQPDGWQLKTNLATDMNDCATAHSGLCSYKIVGNNKPKKLFQSFDSTNPAGPYTLGISAKADAITGVPKVKLSVSYGSVKKGFTLSLPTGTYDWTVFSIPITTTKTWKSAKVTISWKGQGTLHVDDVVISAGP